MHIRYGFNLTMMMTMALRASLNHIDTGYERGRGTGQMCTLIQLHVCNEIVHKRKRGIIQITIHTVYGCPIASVSEWASKFFGHFKKVIFVSTAAEKKKKSTLNCFCASRTPGDRHNRTNTRLEFRPINVKKYIFGLARYLYPYYI